MMRSEKEICFLWFMMVSETADLILDWDFAYEIAQSTDPNVQSTKHWILGFAIWGTVLYIFTIIFLCCDLCISDDEEHPCTASLSLLSTVTEDMPQIVLAIIVASRTTHLISVVQIMKAVYGLIEPLIKTIKLSCDRQNSKTSFRNPSHDNECQKCFDILCSSLLCVCSFVLFFMVLAIW